MSVPVREDRVLFWLKIVNVDAAKEDIVKQGKGRGTKE